MLERVRKPSRAKGMLAYLIFGAIIVVFIGFGVRPDRLGNEAAGVAAVVNQNQISLADFRGRLQMLENQFKGQMDQIPPQQREEINQRIRTRAMEDLIQFEVLVQAAKSRGLYVSDEEIRDVIVEIPAFQEEKRFKRQLYEAYLSQQGMKAGQFEEKIRRDLMVQKLQTVFQESLKSTALEQQLDRRSKGFKMNLEVASFSPEELAKKLPVSTAEVQAYLANAESAAKVKKFYDDNPGQFAEQEEVRARHILISIDRSKPTSEAEAKAKIESLSEKAKTEDFAKLASQNSDDPGSKVKGGDLGYFGRGRMVPEFETAAFGAEVGKIVGPIKSDFGYHLIKVEDHKAARTKSFDEVKGEIAKTELAKTKVSAVEARLNQLVSERSEAQIRKELKTLGVAWVETGDFALDAAHIPKLEDPDKAIAAVLKSGAKSGLVPETVNLAGHTAILIVKSFKEGAAKDVIDIESMSSNKHYDAFQLWAKSAFEQARVQRNQKVILGL